MTIQLFQKTKFRGDSATIRRNRKDLKDSPLGRNPSSLRMTASSDAVLLFKKKEWRGGVMFRRGKRRIENLGSRKEGGRNTFRNNVASVRVTPFFIKLNVTVVTQSDGTVPGTDRNFSAVRTRAREMARLVEDFYTREQALLKVRVAHVNQRVHDNKFNLSMMESGRFPAAWKNRGEIDCILVNSFDSGATGLAKLPWFGKVVIVAMRGSRGRQRSTEQLAKTLAHEIGHFLGSEKHASGSNIMAQGSQDIGTRTATVEQIQEWHTKLSRNPTRRGNRA